MTFELWRLVEVKDARSSTWELVGNFPNAKRARLHIASLAGPNVVSPDEQLYWFEDKSGTHTFRIEAVPTPVHDPQT